MLVLFDRICQSCEWRSYWSLHDRLRVLWAHTAARATRQAEGSIVYNPKTAQCSSLVMDPYRCF
jgi:hypothetical protein